MFENKKELKRLQTELDKLKPFGFEKFGQFTDDDVFIIGYPKSGNTLLQHIIAHLVYGLRKNTSKSLINTCVTEWYNNPWFFRLDKQHFFKSHELPRPEFKNVIYIVRDGRDAVLSYYYMVKNLGEEESLEKLYNTGGEVFVGNWQNHVEAWTTNKLNLNIHFVRYEDLITNKAEELKKICEFLKIERTQLEIDVVIEATSIDNMKFLEKSFSWSRLKSFKNWKVDGKFVREGKTKSYKSNDKIEMEWVDNFTKKSFDMLSKYRYLD
jgi:hypothetical protein